ncbi:MAG: hypothetical protein WC758_06675 [Candidatus Woesearchaeota archaeon]|jgi:hypothetical protein
MLRVEPNLPYAGIVVDFKLLRNELVKVYFTNILGRDPSIYEWGTCGLSQDDLLVGLSKSIPGKANVGVPHIVVSFPHVTAVYRWGNPSESNERETNIYRLGLGKTEELTEIIFPEPKFPFEVGCPAEIHIIGREMGFRSTANTLDEYMRMAVPIGTSIPIANSNMIYQSRR